MWIVFDAYGAMGSKSKFDERTLSYLGVPLIALSPPATSKAWAAIRLSAKLVYRGTRRLAVGNTRFV